MEKAIVVLRKKSSAAAGKKSDRTLGAGVVQAYIHSSKDIGTMVLLSCETDFVSKNEEFVRLAHDIAMHAAATNPAFISRAQVTDEAVQAAKEVFEKEASEKSADKRAGIVEGKMNAYLAERVLLEQPFIKDPSITIQGLVDAASQKFGERIEVGECVRFSVRA
jgi:elongation factor Ts